jgi:hypothetical protein
MSARRRFAPAGRPGHNPRARLPYIVEIDMHHVARITLAVVVAASLLAAGTARAQSANGAAAAKSGIIASIKPEPKRADAAGAAPAGAEAGKSTNRSSTRWVVRVRLDDGRYRGFRQSSVEDLRIGDRVFIENDRIQLERRAARNPSPTPPSGTK